MTKVTFLESPGSIDYCYVFGFHREFRLRPKIVKASRGCCTPLPTLPSLTPCLLFRVSDRHLARHFELDDLLPSLSRDFGYGQDESYLSWWWFE